MEAKLKRQGVEQLDEELFKYDYENYESETEEWLDDEEDEDEPEEEEMLSPEDIERVKLEIKDLENSATLPSRLSATQKPSNFLRA